MHRFFNHMRFGFLPAMAGLGLLVCGTGCATGTRDGAALHGGPTYRLETALNPMQGNQYRLKVLLYKKTEGIEGLLHAPQLLLIEGVPSDLVVEENKQRLVCRAVVRKNHEGTPYADVAATLKSGKNVLCSFNEIAPLLAE